eukprot:TRINITY_DN349_c1_g1_i1.p1 TRINITY_DN349_c1_g1~~TRINITY_DN349_c1_g1_i1.p1  ORF type:complete len:349 (+),score=69.36 TRINITY_DN349_c1_g1_i1:528-1574(+)
MSKNQEWQLVARPCGVPKVEDFKCVDIPTVDESALTDGHVIVEMKALSVDPYMRPRCDQRENSYIPPFELNRAIDGLTVGVVTASKSDKFPTGTFVQAHLPYRLSQIVPEDALNQAYPSEKIPLTYFLGMLGLTGLSSYLPITKIGEPKEGDVVFVTGAAGAVGMAAIQIFKLFGCKVYACAGTDEKVSEIMKLGSVEDAFNYKTVGAENYEQHLSKMIPGGIDIYFDNVGGEMLDAVIQNMKTGGKIICCGAISQYNAESADKIYRLKNATSLIGKCLKMQGFIVSQWKSEFPETVRTLMGHVMSGKLVVKETVVEGFSRMPEAFISMLTGGNIGKMVVTTSSSPSP